MFATLKHTKDNTITLGELRHFINNDCHSLADDTPIDICNAMSKEFNADCITIIADDDSVTFYNY